VIGQTLSHYEVLERIGEGGMGVVYKARDTLLGRLVALKTLPSGEAADPERRARLLREARAASALHHPNIVDVYDLLHQEGSDVIVMELVTGRTLDRAVAGKSLREVLGYARQIADALAKAHAAGIVHRDLKPSNVMVDECGTVRILDFGLARLGVPVGTVDFGSASARPTAEATGTAEGRIVGTLAYMSPEQAEGKKADARSDVFSFGAVLYEMVTGRTAFRGDSAAATLAAVLERDPPPPRELVPGLPADLEKLVQRCLRKDPAKRFQSMGDVALDLDEVAAGLDIARVQSPGKKVRRRAAWLLAGAALLGLAALLGWRLTRGPKRPPAPPRLVQLTSYVGRELCPTFSPDGTQVAFAWNGDRQDNWDIYVKLVGTSGPPLRLTTDPESDMYPSWSPDGRQIAFRRTPRAEDDMLPLWSSAFVWRSAGGAVMVMPALGGVERKVADVPQARCPTLSWTPDGRWLATPATDSSGVSGIFLLPLDQGEARRLTSNSAGVDISPTLSADGRFLAYASCTSDYSCTVQVQELQTDLRALGSPRPLSEARGALAGLAWAADGRSLVYSWGTLYRVPRSGPPGGERVLPGGQRELFPTIARTLDRLIFVRGIDDRDVWKLEDSHSPTPLLASSRVDESAEFSPDGTRIAYQSARWSTFGEIFVTRADGSNPIQLTDGLGSQQGSPQWSPDGRWIAFDSQQRYGGAWDVFVIDAAGGPPRRLTAEASNEHRPSWSRDGRWVYFASDRTGRFEVWRVPAQGGQTKQVTEEGGFTCVESFDGRTLYYVKTRVPRQPLFARPIGGGAETRVVDEVLGRTFAVVENGLYYFARTEAAAVTAIRFLDVARARSREVARLDLLVAPAFGLSVSPDRRTILFTASKPDNADLYLIENFR
jgi:Tol biopolymer transport system component/predicted Ser/Thr protein kinase